MSVREAMRGTLAEGALAQSGELDSDVALIEKPFTAGVLARKVRAVLDA